MNPRDFVKGENKAQLRRAKAIQAKLDHLTDDKRALFNRLAVSWRAANANDPFACLEDVLKYVQGQP